jgi:hypothetical protein
MELALPIAERGRAALPFLTEQLKASKDDVEVRDLLLVFERMDSIGAYKVHDDPHLITLLTSRISEMKDPGWRDTSLKMLHRIEDAATR